MAMIKCPECGHDVSSKALSCPNCGNPINMRQEVPVKITRESKFAGGGCKIVVKIDGTLVGTVKNGSSITTNVMQGNHQIDIGAFSPMGAENGYASAALSIPDDASEVEVEIAMGMTGPSIKKVYYA